MPQVKEAAHEEVVRITEQGGRIHLCERDYADVLVDYANMRGPFYRDARLLMPAA